MSKHNLASLAFSFMSVNIMAASIPLAGEWQLRLDAEDQLVTHPPETWAFDDTISLPGTTDRAKKGPHVTHPIEYAYNLNREYDFLGPAYYARDIQIPDTWAGQETELFLERVMWQSRVWVDGKEVSPPGDSLTTPHIHNLGKLVPGTHRLIIRVDNRMIHPIGNQGHAYGNQTQSTWNGMVGKMELRNRPASRIENVRVFPSLDGGVKVEATGRFTQGVRISAQMIGADAPFARESLSSEQAKLTLHGIAVQQPVFWSEFTPTTYRLRVELTDTEAQVLDSHETVFGFREIHHEGNNLLFNGQSVFMRGNLECAVFPKTGHPPVDVESWRRIWQVYKDHHLNHARFHSWCPPEAAFVAADELGIYLQVEAPIWIDHWMTRPNRRREMDTLGYPQGLGRNDRTIDTFALAEIRRILDTYGNHPSFAFFCLGNELGTSNFDVTGMWIRDAKEYDPRHLYAASTARTITPWCDFNATHNIPHIGGCRQHLELGTNWDYESKYAAASVPIIAHEIGQWPVYPDWDRELPKYTGPLKPLRLEAMREAAEQNGVLERAARYHAASGAANQLLYRDEIESFLRTPSCRGFQLLSLQDFTGQGEAHVGWLDPFYESKGTTDPAVFRTYCAPVVALLKLPSYIYRNSDQPEIGALVRNNGSAELSDIQLRWELKSGDTILDAGTLPKINIPIGEVVTAASFRPAFSRITTATQATLVISGGSQIPANGYPIWIYPELSETPPPANILLTHDWDKAKAALAKGSTVLLLAESIGPASNTKNAAWLPLYWSVPFFPGQNRNTLNLSVLHDHPAYAHFPTPDFGSWNWFRICQGAQGFDLTDISPKDFRPIAEPVSDFHYNRRLASIFEGRVGEGKLLVCGYDLSKGRCQNFPEVAQLRHSLLQYIASDAFHPSTSLDPSVLATLFVDPNAPSLDLPPEFAGADLYIRAGARLRASGNTPRWEKRHDAVLRCAEGVDYLVQADGCWHDNSGTAWHGKEITLTLHPRLGVPGTLRVRFADWNRNERSGRVTVEGKTQELGSHVEGQWLEFPIIREDTNDGELILKATALTGPNLMITDVLFLPSE